MRSLRTLRIVIVIAMVALAAANCGSLPAPYCGDGYCDRHESPYSCPRDCGYTGNSGPGNDPDAGYCGDRLPIASGGITLSVPGMFQQCPEWCWAATITMVANYYGVTIAECGLASSKAGFSQPVCCRYGACAYQACDQPAPPRQMNFILGNLVGIHGYQADDKIAATRLMTELSNGRPVIVGYLNSFAGHVVLVRGFTGDRSSPEFDVIDPYYGEFLVTYDQLAYGYAGAGASWRWAFTWMHLSPSTDGCNRDFDPGCGCD